MIKFINYSVILLLLQCQVTAQHVDTIFHYVENDTLFEINEYYDNGQLAKKEFKTKAKYIFDISELFMRGDLKDTYKWSTSLDSFEIFNKSGVLVEKKNNAFHKKYFDDCRIDESFNYKTNEWHRYKYENFNNTIIEKGNENNCFVYLKDEKEFIELDKTDINFNYKINTVKIDSINFKNISNKSIRIEAIPNPYFLFANYYVVAPNDSIEFIFLVNKENICKECSIDFVIDENYGINIPVKIHSYHLNKNDFKSNANNKKVITLAKKDKSKIILDLDAAEKLLEIYNKGNLIQKISLSRISNNINLSRFDYNTFDLTLINLKTNEKSYCQLKLN